VSLSAHGDWHTLETTSNIVYQLKLVTKRGKIASASAGVAESADAADLKSPSALIDA